MTRHVLALAAVAVVGSLTAATSIAQDTSTAAVQLQQAIAHARQSGRLQRLAGEQYLLCDQAAQRHRLVVSDREIVVESETHYLDSRREWVMKDTVSLSATGTITSMTSAIGSARVLATVRGDVLHMESSGFVAAADPTREDDAPWSEDRLPPLVSDYLWPLLVDVGTLTCTRVGLCPLGTDPLGGSSRSRFSWEDATLVVVARRGGKVLPTVGWSAGAGISVLERDAEGLIVARKGSWPGEETVWQVVTRERYVEALERARKGQ